MSDQISPIADELRRAAARMSPTERALGDALIELAGEVHTAAEMLAAFANRDPDVAPLLQPLVDLLISSGTCALGTHAAVVAGILRPAVH